MIYVCLFCLIYNHLTFYAVRWEAESVGRHNWSFFFLQLVQHWARNSKRLPSVKVTVPTEAPIRAALHLWQQSRCLKSPGNTFEGSFDGGLGTGMPHRLCSDCRHQLAQSRKAIVKHFFWTSENRISCLLMALWGYNSESCTCMAMRMLKMN